MASTTAITRAITATIATIEAASAGKNPAPGMTKKAAVLAAFFVGAQ
jgi:hypothetical protein